MQPFVDDELVGRPFRTSEGLACGLSRHDMGTALWNAPHHGVRAWALSAADDPVHRIRAVAALLPGGGAIGGWAAAYLLGARAVDGRGAYGMGAEPVLVAAPPTRPVRRPRIAVLQSPLDGADVVEVAGIRVTAPLRTAFDLARTRSLPEAVVALDAMAAVGLLRLADVSAYVDRRSGWRGVPRARAAVGLADPATRSPGESRLRVMWVSEARLPRPAVNAESPVGTDTCWASLTCSIRSPGSSRSTTAPITGD
ncbi:MAG: hypothetical protein M3Q27_12520 [Actinomycetota bacterium]|nr:hypothetical protein [Actinomycetota bacterium]